MKHKRIDNLWTQDFRESIARRKVTLGVDFVLSCGWQLSLNCIFVQTFCLRSRYGKAFSNVSGNKRTRERVMEKFCRLRCLVVSCGPPHGVNGFCERSRTLAQACPVWGEIPIFPMNRNKSQPKKQMSNARNSKPQ